jgi:hypothetical protein
MSVTFQNFEINWLVSIHISLYRYIARGLGQNDAHVSIHVYMLRYILRNNWLVSIQILNCIDTKRVKTTLHVKLHSFMHQTSPTSSSSTWNLSKPSFPIFNLPQNSTKTSKIQLQITQNSLPILNPSSIQWFKFYKIHIGSKEYFEIGFTHSSSLQTF